ncbi:MAG: hypothetical protein Q8M19_15810 [Reyranella sp.]|nr:hypothetical protein [Reyranella sp.]
MIWPFKKKHVPMPKQTIPEPLSAARLFKKTLSEQMPNGRAQIVIALWHTPIHLSVFRRALTEEGNHEEFRIEHMLPVLEDQLQRATGDIAPRRLGWLHIAGMLYYLCYPGADVAPAVQDELADIFVMLADSMYVIPNIVEHNVIWSEHEKDPFRDGLFTTKDYAINFLTPPYLRSHPKLKAYAQANGVYISS